MTQMNKQKLYLEKIDIVVFLDICLIFEVIKMIDSELGDSAKVPIVTKQVAQ